MYGGALYNLSLMDSSSPWLMWFVPIKQTLAILFHVFCFVEKLLKGEYLFIKIKSVNINVYFAVCGNC